MKVKQHIRKILIVGLWLVIGVSVTALLIAAIRIKREKTCTGYQVDINGDGRGQWFIDKLDIVRLMTSNGRDSIQGKSTREFDLKQMESRLERDRRIMDAELFFDNNQVLRVKVTERVPIARVITITGSGFYIDSSCVRLPLSEKMSARLPVFTSFPSDKLQLKTADKLLLKEIKKVSTCILQEPFWMAQVSQIDITPKRTFEIIPTIGNHVIEFGNSKNCEQKLKRLFLFYTQVLSKTGLEKYARINVQYEKQIIGIRNNYLSKTDSLKFVKNIEYLIASSQIIDTTRKEILPTAGIKSSEVPISDARSKYVKQ